MEWDLVCERNYLRPFYQTMYTIGCLFGALLGAFLADRYGRRSAVRVGSILTAANSVLLAVSPDLKSVFVCRFMLGIFNTVMVYPACTFAIEVCPPRLRSTVGIMLAIPYALMMIILAILAYFIRDWRSLQLCCSVPAIGLIPLTFLVDESPRWLLCKGRLEEATAILQKAAHGRPKRAAEVETYLHAILPKLSKDLSAENPPENGVCLSCICPLKKLVIGPLRKITLILMVVWFCQAIVYLGIPLSSNYFSSPYMYMIVIGLVELPAYTVTAPITHRYGRKKVIIGSFLLCGICIFLAVIVQLESYGENYMFGLFATAYLMICTSYQVNFIYVQEILPTPLRPFGVSLLALTAYSGFSIPPFLIDVIDSNASWIPTLVFSICALISASAVVLLPETNQESLPDTIADTEKLIRAGRDAGMAKKEKNVIVI